MNRRRPREGRGWFLIFLGLLFTLSCADPSRDVAGAHLLSAEAPPATELSATATPTTGARVAARRSATLSATVPSATQTATPTATILPTDPAAATPAPTDVIPAPEQTALAAAELLSRVAQSTTVPIYTYEIVNVYPHDRAAFTQGLVFEDGLLYEGTGLWGESTLRKVELESGDPLQVHYLPMEYFGEGITIWEKRIIQLTWTSGLGFLYDKVSFEELGTFGYPTEGWGITHDGSRLIMSDGSATLHFWDPNTFQEVGQVLVHDEQGPITWLNELEYVRGMVYANVWQTDVIAIVDPGDGAVTGWIDLTGLLGPEDRDPPVDVLNGIAYDEEGDRLLVTGKKWPKLFEIDLALRSQLFVPYVTRTAEAMQ